MPLPISRHFLHLVRGGELTYAALPPPNCTGGFAATYASVASRLSEVDAAAALGGCSVAERVAQYEAIGESEFVQPSGGRCSLKQVCVLPELRALANLCLAL